MIAETNVVACTSDGFHAGKTTHPAAANKVAFRPLITGMFTSRVGVEEHDQERHLDGEVIHQFR
jgi:hypothetical protein